MPEKKDYTLIDSGTGLKINDNMMNRAVRVKSTVKDKIQRIYSNKNLEVSPKVEEKSVEPLIDTSEEVLASLNEIINKMHNQTNVPSVEKRAVLFTKPLVEKVAANNNWIKIEDNKTIEPVVKVEESVTPAPVESNIPEFPSIENSAMGSNQEEKNTFELPKIESPVLHNDDFVVPFGWDDVELAQKEMVAEPAVIENKFPTIESTPVVSTVEPVEKPKEESKDEIPLMGTQLLETLPSVPEVPKMEENNDIIVPGITSSEPEPVDLDVPVNEVPNNSMSIEDKISELLNRKNEVHAEEKEDVQLTQPELMAKLQRINNTIKDKSIENAVLKNKLDNANETLKEEKSKNMSYAATIKDLTAKYKALSEENAKLTTENLKTRVELGGKVANLEGRVAFLKKSSSDRREELQSIIDQLKEKHNLELEEVRKENAKKIEELTANRDKQLSNIYSAIVQTLDGAITVSEVDSKAKVA